MLEVWDLNTKSKFREAYISSDVGGEKLIFMLVMLSVTVWVTRIRNILQQLLLGAYSVSLEWNGTHNSFDHLHGISPWSGCSTLVKTDRTFRCLPTHPPPMDYCPHTFNSSIINSVIGLQTNPQGVRIYEVVDTSPSLATSQTTAPEPQVASNTTTLASSQTTAPEPQVASNTATTTNDVSLNKSVTSKTPTVTSQLVWRIWT